MEVLTLGQINGIQKKGKQNSTRMIMLIQVQSPQLWLILQDVLTRSTNKISGSIKETL